MNDQAAQYLERLKAGKVLTERVEAAVNTFRFLLGDEEPERIFVCNTIDPAPDQFPYGSIWGFKGPFWMEARQKGATWDVDIASYTGGDLLPKFGPLRVSLLPGG